LTGDRVSVSDSEQPETPAQALLPDLWRIQSAWNCNERLEFDRADASSNGSRNSTVVEDYYAPDRTWNITMSS
jgi:hypothetical protein